MWGLGGGLESPTGFTAGKSAHIVYQQVAQGVKGLYPWWQVQSSNQRYAII
jgi:hypothetical protein